MRTIYGMKTLEQQLLGGKSEKEHLYTTLWFKSCCPIRNSSQFILKKIQNFNFRCPLSTQRRLVFLTENVV